MTDPYFGREQTEAKHFILRRYLQALAFNFFDFLTLLTSTDFRVRGKPKTEDFIDSSFMIAIDVLRDAQQKIQTQTGRRPKIAASFLKATAEFTRLLGYFSISPACRRFLKLKPTAENSKARYPKF